MYMEPFTVTDAAKDQMVVVCNARSADAVRFSIRGGGCAGFEYQWDTVSNDTFDEGDTIVDLQENKKFVVDNMSIMYINGAEFDYVTEAFGSAFRVNNPNATTSCGCGESIGF